MELSLLESELIISIFLLSWESLLVAILPVKIKSVTRDDTSEHIHLLAHDYHHFCRWMKPTLYHHLMA